MNTEQQHDFEKQWTSATLLSLFPAIVLSDILKTMSSTPAFDMPDYIILVRQFKEFCFDESVSCGVLQGSILGPLFCNPFINDVGAKLRVDTFSEV